MNRGKKEKVCVCVNECVCIINVSFGLNIKYERKLY